MVDSDHIGVTHGKLKLNENFLNIKHIKEIVHKYHKGKGSCLSKKFSTIYAKKI